VVRSGRALDAFGLWVADHRPMNWVLDMLQYTTMSTTVETELLERYDPDDPAQLRERQLFIAETLLRVVPGAVTAATAAEALR
jgi:hypothetical protein